MDNNQTKKSTVMIQLFVMALIIASAVIGLNSLSSMKTVKTNSLVRFEVEASGGFAMVTLKTKEDDVIKPRNVNVPWSETLKVDSGTTVILTASNPSVTGEITCNIHLDGVVWKKETTISPKNGVACAGIIP